MCHSPLLTEDGSREHTAQALFQVSLPVLQNGGTENGLLNQSDGWMSHVPVTYLLRVEGLHFNLHDGAAGQARRSTHCIRRGRRG